MNRVTLAILLLFSAALVLYWQVQLKQGEQDNRLQQATTEPDFVADDLHSLEFDEKGRLNSRVSASHMEHYEEKALTYFTSPVYLVYPDDGKAQWRLQANQGTLDKNSGKVTLENNVIIDAISPDEPVQTLSTSQLELDLDTMIMTSDRLITITGAGFIIQGTGLNADLNAQEVTLTSQIKGTYEAK